MVGIFYTKTLQRVVLVFNYSMKFLYVICRFHQFQYMYTHILGKIIYLILL